MDNKIKKIKNSTHLINKNRLHLLTLSGLFAVCLFIPTLDTEAETQTDAENASLVSSHVTASGTFSQKDADNDNDIAIDASYGFEQLKDSFVATINLSTEVDDNKAQLVKFSSLSPNVLALMFPNNHPYDTQEANHHYRIVDAKGRVMPTLLRAVSKTTVIDHPVQVVSVETDNPSAVEKLRQILRLELENPNNQSAVNVDIEKIPSNPIGLANNNPVRTWWLANPSKNSQQTAPNVSNKQGMTLWLKFANATATPPTSASSQRPLQLQIYGSNDLQSWQMISQTVVSPFDKPSTVSEPTAATTIHEGNAIGLNAEQMSYRYWQVVANQPVNLAKATASQSVLSPSYFLTRASFEQDKQTPTQWHLNLPQPVLASGVNFFIPENQLWQLEVKIPQEDAQTLARMQKIVLPSNDVSLVKGQVDKNHTELTWQPNLMKSLILTGQMQQDDVAVNLLTPMYEMYFLAQGTAPYRLLINEPNSLQEPAINLSEQQLTHLGNAIDGQMQPIATFDNPNAMMENYKKWALWGVLALIVIILGWLAYRLYQQTTTKVQSE